MFVNIMSITVVCCVVFGIVGFIIDFFIDRCTELDSSFGAYAISTFFWFGVLCEFVYFLYWCFENVIYLLN